MAYTSFYGGRMGASFVIVKQFDGINIPNETTIVYKKKIYAVHVDPYSSDNDKVPIVRQPSTNKYIFIEQTADNYKDYEWEVFELKGGTIRCWIENQDPVDPDGPNYYTNHALDKKPAEGMVQFFEQGGSTTSGDGGVNYGEYVIIDTIVGLGEKNNPDNGKVFRRGMNYQVSEDNPLAGAEYIGQIVGPQGDTPEIDLMHYNEIHNLGEPYIEKEYSEATEDLVPGFRIDEQTGDRIFEDNIKWIYKTIRDPLGNVQGCSLGFIIPTLVEDFVGTSISPYEHRVIKDPPDPNNPYIYTDLIEEDPNEYGDHYKQLNEEATYSSTTQYYAYDDQEDQYNNITTEVNENNFEQKVEDGLYIYLGKDWKHPFYQKWQVHIPQGYHGTDSTNLELVHTKTMPKDFKENYNGALVWNDPECENDPYIKEGVQVQLENSESILKDAYDTVYIKDEYNIIYDPTTVSCKVMVDNQIRYVKKEDCYMDELRYKETDWSDEACGRLKFIKIGDYNNIQRVDLAEDGTLIAYYSAITDPQQLEEAIRWIDYTMSAAIPKNMDWYEDTGTQEIHNYKKSMDERIDKDHPKTFYTVIPTITEPETPIDLNYCYEYDDINRCYKKTSDNVVDNKIYYKLEGVPVSNPDEIKGITLDKEGTVTVYYNTIHDGEHDKTEFKNALNWITNAYIDSKTGKFKILYNNNNVPPYETTLKYINEVAIQTNKITEDPQTGEIIDEGEGSGDQMMYITYTTDPEPKRIKGKPLNYIIESAIVTDPNLIRTVEEVVIDPETGEPVIDPETGEPEINIIKINVYGHLLIRFSDPAYRLKFKDLWVTYYSTKEEKDFTDWIDMGNIHGANGGLQFVTEVFSYDELKDSQGKWIPPELLTDKVTGDIINPNAVGWSVAYTYKEYQQLTSSDEFDEDKDYYVKDNNDNYIKDESVTAENFAEKVANGLYIVIKSTTEVLYFDYQVDINGDYLGWKTLGTIDSSAINPAKVIVLTKTDGDPGDVNEEGFWLIYESIKCAY